MTECTTLIADSATHGGLASYTEVTVAARLRIGLGGELELVEITPEDICDVEHRHPRLGTLHDVRLDVDDVDTLLTKVEELSRRLVAAQHGGVQPCPSSSSTPRSPRG